VVIIDVHFGVLGFARTRPVDGNRHMEVALNRPVYPCYALAVDGLHAISIPLICIIIKFTLFTKFSLKIQPSLAVLSFQISRNTSTYERRTFEMNRRKLNQKLRGFQPTNGSI
jgi:hypothetical protein